MNRKAALIQLSFGIISLSFILGYFFNGANPSFYPTGTTIPPQPTCDLLSNFARLCLPSVRFPWFGGTLSLNFDVPITMLTFGGLFVGIFILHREEPV